MNTINKSINLLGALGLGSLAALFSFFILLSSLWAAAGSGQLQQLAGLLVSVAVALLLGGFISGMLFKSAPIQTAVLFGFIFGGCSFTYILSGTSYYPLFLLGGLVFTGLGGRMAQYFEKQKKREVK